MTPTQPTTDEVAIKRAAQQFCDNHFDDGFSVEELAATFSNMIDTHSAKLREENEGLGRKLIELSDSNDNLRTQNELLQSHLSKCVRQLKMLKHRSLTLTEIESLLSTLPTTPNLVEQVRELEKRLDAAEKVMHLGYSTIRDSFVEPQKSEDFNNHYNYFFEAPPQQTLSAESGEGEK